MIKGVLIYKVRKTDFAFKSSEVNKIKKTFKRLKLGEMTFRVEKLGAFTVVMIIRDSYSFSSWNIIKRLKLIHMESTIIRSTFIKILQDQ